MKNHVVYTEPGAITATISNETNRDSTTKVTTRWDIITTIFHCETINGDLNVVICTRAAVLQIKSVGPSQTMALEKNGRDVFFKILPINKVVVFASELLENPVNMFLRYWQHLDYHIQIKERSQHFKIAINGKYSLVCLKHKYAHEFSPRLLWTLSCVNLNTSFKVPNYAHNLFVMNSF